MQLVVRGMIAMILLGLYIYAVVTAVNLAMSPEDAGELNEGFVLILHTVGGLVSALVVAELAVTRPGEMPAAQAVAAATAAAPKAGQAVKVLTALYLLAWVVLGLVALIVGTLHYPGRVQPLTDLGQAWFGIAVAAGYAYLGVTPPSNRNNAGGGNAGGNGGGGNG